MRDKTTLVLIGVVVALVVVASTWVIVERQREAGAPPAGGGACSAAFFYEYGASWCPSCRSLHEFFSSKYPNQHFFCAIDVYKACDDGFTKFATEVTGSGSIPQTLVLVNRTHVLAVVIGAVTEEGFWASISCAQPSARVPVYYGTRLLGYLDLNTTDHSSFIEKYVVPPEKARG